MRKIEITEIHIQSPDFKSGILNNQPKDRTILNWLIQWVEDGLNKDILHFGDLIPSKKELAKYLNVSTGTLQNAVKYAEVILNQDSALERLLLIKITRKILL